MLVVDPTDQVHRVRRVDAGVLQRDFASGTTEVTQYDDAGRCVAKASLGTAGLWRRRFWRSGEGDLLQRDDDRRGTTRFRYDAAHRLDGVQRPDGTVDVYAHDAAGNLLQKPGVSEGYVAGIQAGPAAEAFDTSSGGLRTSRIRGWIATRQRPCDAVSTRWCPLRSRGSRSPTC